MRNREFGVELEFDSNGLEAHGVGELLWKNGFREEWIGDRTSFVRYSGEQVASFNGISHDGSEIEIRTPILKGKKGFNDLKKVVNLLRDAGCYTTEVDGLHVHHNAPDYVENKELIVKLLRSWKYNEFNIASFIEEERAGLSLNWDDWGDGSPCPTFEMSNVIALENRNNATASDISRSGFERNNLNINSLTKHGSIEFRFHEGTLNWDEIESWIRFGQSLLNGVKRRKTAFPPADNPVILMNRLKTNKRAMEYLSRKSRLVRT